MTLNKHERKLVKEAIGKLNAIANGITPKAADKCQGLCNLCIWNLSRKLRVQVALPFEQMFEAWEHFSGNHNYPVPSASSDLDPEEYYDEMFHYCKDMYDKKTWYGQKRRELAAHCAKWIKEWYKL